MALKEDTEYLPIEKKSRVWLLQEIKKLHYIFNMGVYGHFSLFLLELIISLLVRTMGYA